LGLELRLRVKAGLRVRVGVGVRVGIRVPRTSSKRLAAAHTPGACMASPVRSMS
tara:strand:+ start:468 stop:629 length:162 start_codon:yes stop_codon:yes gene_type:complete